MDMVFGYMLSRTVYAVAKLGIADLLADGPKTSAELAQATGTHAPSLYQLLRALASRGIFEESAEGCFGLTPNAALLRSDIFGSLRAHAIMYGEEQFQAWDEILYCIRTGQPGFDIIYGKGMYEYLAEHPDAAMTFNTAMGNSTVVLVEEIIRAYDFSGFSIIVDVAGNQGQQLAAILRANPGSHGILFDQPYVVQGATQVLEQAGVLDRCEIVGGDFFTSVPNSGDVYIIKNALLAYNSLLAMSGLSLTRVVPIQSGSSVLECVPA
jgi:O-methyltransferase domain/Dimerisation domain